MAESLKTLAITQLDAAAAGGTISPSGTGRSASGFGAEGFLKEVNGIITPTALATSPSIYRFARVPSNAVIKHIWSVKQGLGAVIFTGDVTVAYSDSVGDGTLPANQGATITAALFAAAHTFGSDTDGVPVELTFLNAAAGKYGLLSTDFRNQPLWQAAGLTGDPGGYFDIIVSTTATNGAFTAGGTVQLSVQFMTWGQ